MLVASMALLVEASDDEMKAAAGLQAAHLGFT